MLNKFFGIFSKDIGIDLGTANTLVYVKGEGIIINEPSVVALNHKTGQVLAVGVEAKRMVGRTPAHITAVRPLINGVISDFEVTEQMLKYFINKVHATSFNIMPRPRIVIGIPFGITEVEKKAVEDACRNAGARAVYLIEEPIAAAIGARMPIEEPSGNLIVDIGGGTTDIAVLSLGGIVAARSLKVAGDKFNEDIVNFAKTELKILIGDKTAEEIKLAVGSAYPQSEQLEVYLKGRDLITGLPKEVLITDSQIRKAFKKSLRTLVEAIRATIESTPPELVADILKQGIILAGGGALLRGLDKLLQEEIMIPVKLTDDPLTAVVRGTGIILEDVASKKDFFVKY